MSPSNAILSRYRYSALDLLTAVERGAEVVQRFYAGEQLATVYRAKDEGDSVFQQGTHLLAVQSREGDQVANQLLITDLQRSVLHTTGAEGAVRQAYTAYGHRRVERGPGSLLGFNGEALDRVTGHYLLGNGHRAFNPVLMRFNSPDRLSPFDRGGLNPYAYCLGDPVNFTDPTGRLTEIVRFLSSAFRVANAGIVLQPAIPYKLAKNALQWGAAGHLPFKTTLGAAGSVTAGITTMIAAITGTLSAVAASRKDTEAAAVLGFITLGLGAITLAGRIGSGWAARDKTTIPQLKSFVDAHKQPVAKRPSFHDGNFQLPRTSDGTVKSAKYIRRHTV